MGSSRSGGLLLFALLAAMSIVARSQIALAAAPEAAVPLPACGPPALPHSANQPEAMLGIRLTQPTTVRVTAASTTIRCKTEQARLECAAETTYALVNQAATEIRIRGQYFGAASSFLKLSWAGRPLPLNPFYDDESLAQVNVTAVAARQPARAGDLYATFDFTVPAASEGRLSFWSTVSPCQTDRPFTNEPSSSSLLHLRHAHFAPKIVDERLQRFSFELWPVRQWLGNAQQRVKISFPPEWIAEVRGFPVRTLGPGLLEGEQDGSLADVMVLTLRHAQKGPLLNGGPLVAMGARLDQKQVRWRAGYELGIGESASTSLVFDHELNRYSTFAWMWEVGTHSGLFWPSFTIGAGPLLRLGSSHAAFGGRVQGGLSFKLLSFGVSLDVHHTEPEQLAPFAWGQVSF